MHDLEKKICQYFHKSYGIYTGNATSAMYIAFKSLKMQEKKVIFPAISCTNPVNAAIYAGYDVDFCDVQLSDYTIDLEKLEKMLKTNMYGIIVPTHIYGHFYNREKVNNLAQKYNVIVFEDAAQTYCVGEADISVMSFGHTKIYETVLGGGIVFTEDKELFENMYKERKKLLSYNHITKEYANLYREKYYNIIKKQFDWKSRNKELRELQLNSKESFIFNMEINPYIQDKLENADEIIKEREEKVRLYEQKLDNNLVIKPTTPSLSRWRYTFLYKGDRDFLLMQSRKNNIDISSWYLSLNGIYNGKHMENADQIENQVVNLWIDEKHSIEQIQREIKILNKIMENDYERNK